MNNNPFIYIDYVCGRCGAELCATNFFIGKRKPCRHCGYENIVPVSSTANKSTNAQSDERRHPQSDGPHAKREELYYASILELPSKVTRDEIKKAYKQQLLRYHPDRVQHLGREFGELAHQKTRLINEAYDYFRRAYGL